MKENIALQRLQVESAKNTIIDNLKITHQSKSVNFGCATRGIDDHSVIHEAISTLIAEGQIKIKEYPVKGKFGMTNYLTMYQYNNQGW